MNGSSKVLGSANPPLSIAHGLANWACLEPMSMLDVKASLSLSKNAPPMVNRIGAVGAIASHLSLATASETTAGSVVALAASGEAVTRVRAALAVGEAVGTETAMVHLGEQVIDDSVASGPENAAPLKQIARWFLPYYTVGLHLAKCKL